MFCHPIQARFELKLCIMLSSQTKDSPHKAHNYKDLYSIINSNKAKYYSVALIWILIMDVLFLTGA